MTLDAGRGATSGRGPGPLAPRVLYAAAAALTTRHLIRAYVSSLVDEAWFKHVSKAPLATPNV